MKQIRYIGIVTVMLLAAACSREEADIFPESPAERLDNAINNYFSLLTGSANGWEMDYFANSESPGYTLLVKLNASGEVVMASKSELTANKAYEEDRSLFDIIGDEGPVLTFNTYNEIMHVFSNPVDPDGYGLEGDYEFVIMKASQDTVWLKGKKHKAPVLMRRLPETVSWTDHMDELSDMSALLFSKKSPPLTLKTGKSVYTFSGGYGHMFSVVKEGAGAETMLIPFIITPQGLRFQTAHDFDGSKLQCFALNESKTGLVSVENPEMVIAGTDNLAQYFVNNVIKWNINPEGNASMRSAYDRIVDFCEQTYQADDVKLNLTYSAGRKSFVVNMVYSSSTARKEGNMDLSVSTKGKDVLSLSYKGTGDANGLEFYNTVDGMQDFMSFFAAEFILTTDARINPDAIRVTNQSDASSWITIEAQ